MSRIIIFDIETKPKEELVEFVQGNIKAPANYKDENKIAGYIEEKKLETDKKMATDIDFAKIKIIGYKELGAKAEILGLEEFMNKLKKSGAYTLVSFGGKRFDVPIVVKEAVASGIDIEPNLFNCTKKYDNSWHIDMEDILSFGNRENVKSLNNYAMIYLGKQKKPIDFRTASDEELREHCIEDLNLTEELYLKFRVLI